MSYLQPPTMDDMDSFIDFSGGLDGANFPEEQQTFSGPSHEYDSFRQQTGLPTGAVSNVAAYNDLGLDDGFLSNSDFNSYSATSSELGPNSAISFNGEYERTPRTSVMYYPSSSFDDFGASSSAAAMVEPQPPPPPVRMWPGMHTQQAEQAKAAALAKQQQERFQGQQIMQQRQSRPNSMSVSAGKQRQSPQEAANAERRISEILDGMRHKTTASPISERDDDTEAARNKKLDDDMDEDERLLASEEGKKLSSKERRQLRNKVSARAFRSRRKEYISQLEGDIAAKVNETNDLKLLNRKLLDENNQLKNLTRTLLSHPAFQTFLEDMSRNQTFLRGPAPQNFPGAMEVLPSNADDLDVKQEPESQQQHPSLHNDNQINMAQVPETHLDFSTLNLGSNHWNFQQPTVFSVYDVPVGPTIGEIRSPRLPSEKEGSRDLFAEAVRATVPVEPEYSPKDMPSPIELPKSTYSKCLPQPLPTNRSGVGSDLYDETSAVSSKTVPRHGLRRITTTKLSPMATSHQSPETAISTINHLFDSLERRYGSINELTWHLPRR